MTTVYLDPRSKQDNIEEVAEDQEKKEAVKALASIISFFTKPLILMLLWNWLMPGLFGLATIGYLKSFGLYLISRILFSKND